MQFIASFVPDSSHSNTCEIKIQNFDLTSLNTPHMTKCITSTNTSNYFLTTFQQILTPARIYPPTYKNVLKLSAFYFNLDFFPFSNGSAAMSTTNDRRKKMN